MKINTTRFGHMNIDPERVINFTEGVPGFGDKKFVLLTPEDTAPFCWLQSVESPEVSFVVIDPLVYVGGYSPQIPPDVFEHLDIKQDNEVLLLTVVVMPSDIKRTTINLAAPIIINVDKKLAKQEILTEGNYPLRYLLFENLSSGKGEG